MSVELLMPLIVILPLIAALLIRLTSNNPNLRETVTPGHQRAALHAADSAGRCGDGGRATDHHPG